MDFYLIWVEKSPKKIEVKPKFQIVTSKDVYIKGGDFYAFWNESTQSWSTDEDALIAAIDNDVWNKVDEARKIEEADAKMEDRDPRPVIPFLMRDADSGVIDKWHKYCQKQKRDNFKLLDQTITFKSDQDAKEKNASKRLDYDLVNSNTPAYDKLISTLYDPDERQKIEWLIGSVYAGESKTLQKFAVFYGDPGSGKSTILNLVEGLFQGYCGVFESQALVNGDPFALEPFRNASLVMIDHEGKLDRITDNTKLNSLVSHDPMVVNEKFAKKYTLASPALIMIATNNPVAITDSKSGVIRRLIDIYPSGRLLSLADYEACIRRLPQEYGGIASHCLSVYNNLKKGFYDTYRPERMIKATNPVADFVDYALLDLKAKDGFTKQELWTMYSQYMDTFKIPAGRGLSRQKFAEEMRSYFKEFLADTRIDGVHVRSYYKGFDPSRSSKTKAPEKADNESRIPIPEWLVFDKRESMFDSTHSAMPAQYANAQGAPKMAWDNVQTTLADIDTRKEHYTRLSAVEVVADFDLKDENGRKCRRLNLEAASAWTPTYGEYSKSGEGVHLHYYYEGDISELKRLFAPDIEVKLFPGKSALRRKLTYCNALPIATITNLPKKKKKSEMIDEKQYTSEKRLRAQLVNCLKKRHHGHTAPEVSFIKTLLDEAYASGQQYDVSDMRGAITQFAAKSTNQASTCLQQVVEMKFKSADAPIEKQQIDAELVNDNDRFRPIVFFDIEVFQNLLVVCWKLMDNDENKYDVNAMVNPTPFEVLAFIKRYRLIGYNNLNYDNQILYARTLGYSERLLYDLSQRIIAGTANTSRSAKALSYTDIYDYTTSKMRLKEWEILLGLPHKECPIPWDAIITEEQIPIIIDYCKTDVRATEGTFHATDADFRAREIIAEITGLTVNNTTKELVTALIFEGEKNPDLIYTDLATGKQWHKNGAEVLPGEFEDHGYVMAFPGYEHVQDENGKWHNMYRGTDLKHGGYAIGWPGYYENVALDDVESQHPTSMEIMNYFGDRTPRFSAIKNVRLAIKHGDLEKACSYFEGKLNKFIIGADEKTIKDLAYGMKILINIVYGLTSASFESEFHDSRNTNNIVALRGALFMRTLEDEVRARGFDPAHIKTDSIKIPDATPEIQQFVIDFGHKYGYNFDTEAVYEKMVIVDDANYIAKYANGEEHKMEFPSTHELIKSVWTATGDKFSRPYTFKTLFAGLEPTLRDMSIVFKVGKSKTTGKSASLYLDFNEDLPDPKPLLKQRAKMIKAGAAREEIEEIDAQIAACHNYVFVGGVGLFTPVPAGVGGAELLRYDGEKYGYASGAKGYRWREMTDVEKLGLSVDMEYWQKDIDSVKAMIEQYVPFEEFIS